MDNIVLPPVQLPKEMQEKMLEQLQENEMRQFTVELRELAAFWQESIYQAVTKFREVTSGDLIREREDVSDFIQKRLEENLALSKTHSKKMHVFQPGDRVVIDAPLHIFRRLQNDIGVEYKNLSSLKEKPGVIVERHYPHRVGVRISDTGSMVYVHEYALKLVTDFETLKTESLKQSGKVATKVKVKLRQDVVKIMLQGEGQRALNIVDLIYQKTGVVVAGVRSGTEVLVSWGSVHLKLPITSLETEPENPSDTARKNPKDGSTGKHMIVKDDLHEVMQLQGTRGLWHYQLTKYIGKVGQTIANDWKNTDNILVCFDNSICFLFHPKAVKQFHASDRKRNKSGKTKPDLGVGDIVRFNIDSQMAEAFLSLQRIFKECLPLTLMAGEVQGYISKSHVVVSFAEDLRFMYDARKLVKVPENEAALVKQRNNKNRNLSAGDEVIVRTGTKKLLKKLFLKFPEDILETMTLKGFDEFENAIVATESGKMFSVPEKYICVPYDEWDASNDDDTDIPETPRNRRIEKDSVKLSADDLDVLHVINQSIREFTETCVNTAVDHGKRPIFDMHIATKTDSSAIEVIFYIHSTQSGKLGDIMEGSLKNTGLVKNLEPLEDGMAVMTLKNQRIKVKLVFVSETAVAESASKELNISDEITEEAEEIAAEAEDIPESTSKSSIEEGWSSPDAVHGILKESAAMEDSAEPDLSQLGLNPHEVQTLIIPPGVKQVVLQLGEQHNLPIIPTSCCAKLLGRQGSVGQQQYQLSTVLNGGSYHFYDSNVDITQLHS